MNTIIIKPPNLNNPMHTRTKMVNNYLHNYLLHHLMKLNVSMATANFDDLR